MEKVVGSNSNRLKSTGVSLSVEGFMSGEQRAEPKGLRVESWKGIASFFQRDERTVKRWERERGLPVHRMPGERGGVFAYANQLEVWLNSGGARAASRSDQRVAEPATALTTGAPMSQADDVAATVDSVAPMEVVQPAQESLIEVTLLAQTEPALAASADGGRWMWAAAAVAVLLALFLALWSRQRPAVKAWEGGAKNADAHELYLNGKYFWTHRTEESLKHAEEAFTQAVVHDPNYAPAYAGLAETYDLLPQYSSETMADDLPKAMIAARRAIELDESLAEAHRALGWALFFGEWDIKGSFAEFQRALELDPNDVEAHHWYGNSLITLGRYEEGRKQLEAARQLEPSSSSIELDYANALYYTQNQQTALSKMLEIERLDENYLGTPRYMRTIYLKRGDYADFVAQSKLAAGISRNPGEQKLAEAAESGWTAGSAQSMLERAYTLEKTDFDAGRSSGYELGMLCILLGRRAEADRFLRASFDKRDSGAMSIASDPFFDRMKDDAAFLKLKSDVQSVLRFD